MYLEDKQDARIYWIVIVALLLLTRLVAMAHYLSIDNVNLAFALESFDPLNHQPQPPGYPFFVLFTRILFFIFRSVELTFLVTSLVVTGLCLPLIYALGRRMFSLWSGRAAVLLLLINPVFWQTGADSPLRPFLALFSLLIAYLAWRCWKGEGRFAIWAAVALGIGSGFRPELLPYLFPLWVVAVWIGTRSVKQLVTGAAVIGAIVAVWVGALAVAVGGIEPLNELTSEYLVDQSRGESPLLGAGYRAWLRQMSRLIVWNGLATVWWIWAFPLLLRKKARLAFDRSAVLFMIAWLAPGLFQSAAVHVAAPGHTLFSIPALCLIGAHVLFVAARQLTSSEESFMYVREVLFSAALIFSVMAFLNFFPVPDPAEAAAGGGPSLRNAAAFATHETSLTMVRSMDQVAFQTLKDLRADLPPDRPSTIVTTDVHSGQWIMNWRILRYYEPGRDIWVLRDQSNPPSAMRVRRHESLESTIGSTAIPVPRRGRILWVLDRTSPFFKELASTRALSGGQYVVYTDLPDDAEPFTVGGFQFVPQ